MSNQLCFVIEHNRLFMDKGLVYYNEAPIFFVCFDSDGKYYLALCSDLDDLEYIVVEISKKTLYEMLTQKITMRQALLSNRVFWSIKAADEVDDDIVECKDISEINCDVLPFEDAYYQTISSDDSDYIERIKSEYLREVNFLSSMEIAVYSKGIFEISLSADSSVDKIHVSNSFYDFGPKIKHSINTFELTTHDASKSYKMLSLCDRLSDISDFFKNFVCYC